MTEHLVVWYGANRVGELYLGPDGRSIGLRYDTGWQQQGVPISQSLPLQQEDFCPEQGRAHRWFGNLLPEEGSRSALVRRLGVADDDYALLRALGGDCAGALRLLVPAADESESVGVTPADLNLLKAWASGHDRYALMEASENRPARLSLAGAQDKIPVVLNQTQQIFLPQGSTPSSHILKFSEKSSIIINELCMNSLAESVGLASPDTCVLRVGEHAMLAVRRYDREHRAGKTDRIHQEDMCQALGIARSKKYQADGGPDLRACAELIRRSTVAPAKAIAQLMQWQIFNVLAGNSDGHAKNISLLQSAGGGWQLAPSYDLVCTRVLPYDASLAFSVGEQFNPQQVIKRDWESMAEQLSVAPPYLLKQVRMMAERLLSVLEGTAYQVLLEKKGMLGHEWEKMQHLRKYVKQQCRKTLKLI